MPSTSSISYSRVGRSDIASAITHIREKEFTTGVIALYDPSGWQGEPILEVAGARVAVVDTPTPLAMRHAVSFPNPDVDFTVLVAPFLDADLPADILTHLTPFHRVNIPIPADALRELFSATTQRRGLIRNRRDIGDVVAYLDRRNGAPVDLTPAPAGVLTADHLNQQLLTVGAGLPPTLTMPSIIQWSLQPQAAQQWADYTSSVSAEVAQNSLDWLRTRLGEASGALVRYLQTHGPRDLATWGLVAEVIQPGPSVDDVLRATAEGAFRISTGIGPSSADELEAWSNAVVTVFTTRPRPVPGEQDHFKVVASRAEEMITSPTQLGARELLYRSRVCAGALDARIAQLTTALDRWYADPQQGMGAEAVAEAVAQALASVRDHVAGHADHPDVTVAMAVIRMIQWLRTEHTAPPTTLSGWLRHYRGDLSWLDVCINQAWSNQSTSQLAQLSHRVLAEVRPRRATLDREFAALAATTATERHTAGGTLLVEDVLDRVVAPLMGDMSKPRPVLMIVLDGMSVPAANVLVENILADPTGQWQEAIPEEELSTALSVLPSVTTFSRTSLISGRLATGGQAEERAGLRDWAATHLKNQSSGWSLLHKADLDSGIVGDIRDKIEDTDNNKLVVAVLNTIDDALDKSDPVERVWDVRDITHLHPLLRSAAVVGRTVVFVSDHGHVLERHDTSPTPGGTGAARWRDPLSPAGPGEVLVDGSRVRNASHEAILAVDEGVRYTSRKAGYHGGLSLAEVAIPVTILSNSVQNLTSHLPGFPLVAKEDSDRYPGWWHLRPGEVAAPLVHTAPAQTVPVDDSPTLFDAPVPTAPEVGIFPGLENNQLFKAQTASHPVDGHKRGEVADLIRRITANNGRMPVATLRELWNLGPIQLRGVISTLLRILNVDGVQVLEQQESDLVLNRNLLTEQFDVKDS